MTETLRSGCALRFIGNPVKIGNGPTAVTGDVFYKSVTVLEKDGKAIKKQMIRKVRRPALKAFSPTS